MKPIKKELFVTKQSLKFTAKPQTEPEAQGAVREFQVAAPTGFQQAGAQGLASQAGSIPAIVQYASTAGEMALARKTSCAGCKHFDVAAWRKFVADSTGPLAKAEDKQTIQTMKGRIALASYGYLDAEGKLDVDATLLAHGICRVLSDWVEGVLKQRDPIHWPVVPWREATCPPTCHAGKHQIAVVTLAQPLGFFVPKDLDAEKIGAKRYDEVLRAVQGKL